VAMDIFDPPWGDFADFLNNCGARHACLTAFSAPLVGRSRSSLSRHA
jgi:hypothetical protein